MSFLLKYLIYPLLFLISIWNVSFGFIAGYVCLALLIFALWRKKKKKELLLYRLTPLIWIIINILFLKNSINTFNNASEKYITKIQQSEQLSFREKFNIYGLNIFMSVVSYPLYPEVAKESFMMAFRTKTGTRVFEDDFFLKSPKIAQAVKNSKLGKPFIVKWRGAEYAMGQTESRFALALNPCRMIIKKEGSNLITVARVSVSYPENYVAILTHQPFEIKIQEGLFSYLQKCGWLHPYEAVWISKN